MKLPSGPRPYAPAAIRRLAALALAPAAALLLACGGESDEGEAGSGDRPAVGARTAVVTIRPFTETIGAIGAVTPRAGHVAALGAPVPARVTGIFVAAGQHVSSGDRLVELEQATVQADARSAEAALSAAERAHERAQRLADSGIVPRRDVEQAAAELARARAQAVAAHRAEELSTLRAPFDGVVTRMAAVLGAAADPSQPLVEVADPSSLDIVLSLTAADAARVRVGASVALSTGQGADGQTLGTGAVVDVGGVVDPDSRSVAVRVEARATRRPLRIGETLFGSIAVATIPRAITVPLEALVPDGEVFKVFVVDSAGVAHARVVSVGGRTDQLAEITSGLAAGERVVTYGAYGVEDSATVVPMQPPAPSAAPPKSKP
jgi:RND family efflux transporter MFP subunit